MMERNYALLQDWGFREAHRKNHAPSPTGKEWPDRELDGFSAAKTVAELIPAKYQALVAGMKGPASLQDVVIAAK